MRVASLRLCCYITTPMKNSLFRSLIASRESIVNTTNIVQSSNGNITINGKTYKGRSVSVNNNKVYIDGKRVDDKELPSTILEIEVKGDLVELTADGSVNCDNVKGDVKAGGSVNCDDVGGNVDAGGSVNCDDVRGSVNAGGSVHHG